MVRFDSMEALEENGNMILKYRFRHDYWEEDALALPRSDKNRKPCYVCYTYPPYKRKGK